MTKTSISAEKSLSERITGLFAKLLGKDGTQIPVVRLHGSISAEQRPNRVNIEMSGPLLEKAFRQKSAPAVAIVINSPGGSAVQSRLVSKRIRDLADKHEKKVYVFVEDVAASGGYFIAVAGDEIFVDPSSIVGSIGVIMGSFGFVEAIEKLGVTRRIYTAGKNKNMLDPFLPENEEHIEKIKVLEDDIHQTFIDWVKSHRDGKLTAEDGELFTGEFWTGTRGVELGLVDAVGDLHSVLREKYGDDVKLRPIARKRRGLFGGLPFGFGAQLTSPESNLAADLVSEAENKTLWSRFGL